MWKKRIIALLILLVVFGASYFVFKSEPKLNKGGVVPKALSAFPFRLGLDLSGGTHLVYRADVSLLKSELEIRDSMASLRDVIERRVNLFGVSEPVVQLQAGGFANQGEERLIIDLPGVTDVSNAVAMIGQTPLLEFKIERPDGAEKDALIKKMEEAQKLQAEGKEVNFPVEDPYYLDSGLTGRFLEKAILEFDQNTMEPQVGLQFNKEGSELFRKITKENVNKTVAIYLDGMPISTPVVREEISGGQAQITGNFNPKEAKTLVGRLNSGALPVPIELISTQTIGASLGEKAVGDGAKAVVIGFLAIALFLLIWYRLPGLIAVLALAFYVAIVLALFKLIPVTLTAAGIAGFVISLGIAVDGNVLIFERLKEELKDKHGVDQSIKNGFSRAWFSIRDSNISSLITAIILFWFGTSLIQGFALTFGLGVLISMFSAVIVTKALLFAIGIEKNSRLTRILFGSFK